jgi:agmatine deiminase
MPRRPARALFSSEDSSGAARREPAFLMPAEWEPHAATWLAWPHNRSDWPGKYEPIPWVYAEIVRHIAAGELVHIVVNDRAWEQKACAVLTRSHVPIENVRFHRWPTDRVWTRDSGAIFVRDGQATQIALDWRFNAWAKYNDWHKDDKLAARMARYLGLNRVQPVASHESRVASDKRQVVKRDSGFGPEPGSSIPAKNRLLPDSRRVTRDSRLVLEGGSIDVNGCGAILTTEECLLSSDVQVRNPGLRREDLECAFRHYLGARKVIWLERGIAGDDTHGHIDDIARFVSPDTVVAAVEPNRDDPNYEPLRRNLDALRKAGDQDGKPLRVVELPMPAPVIFRGQRLPASYANFYIANAAVLVPTFNDPKDSTALNLLAELFPARRVVGIACRDLIWGLGAIHCLTQQQPK